MRERKGEQERQGRAARQGVTALGAAQGAQGPEVRTLGDAELRMYIVLICDAAFMIWTVGSKGWRST